jgi:hypothetical protein
LVNNHHPEFNNIYGSEAINGQEITNSIKYKSYKACKFCGAPIYFVSLENRRIPINADDDTPHSCNEYLTGFVWEGPEWQ